MSAPTPAPTSILILGAGVFGLSTALTLLSRPHYKNTHITLLDASPTLPNPTGSSVDASRIVRADYAYLPYSRLALAAQKHWRDTSASGWGGQGRYHEPGFVLTCDASNEKYLRASLQNVRDLARGEDEFARLDRYRGLEPSQIEVLKDQDAIRRASGYEGVNGDSGYVNWGSGWVDAEACVRFALSKLRSYPPSRVTIRAGCKVERLLYDKSVDGSRRCTGAQLTSSTQIHADVTILATGAWTPTLINLQGRAIATGQVLAYIPISAEEEESMRGRPTIMNMSTGMFVIPPRGRELKVARHGFGYRNLVKIWDPDLHADRKGRGEEGMIEISLPAMPPSIPVEAQHACRTALSSLVPGLANRPFSRSRICWYCDTPTGDFIITPHPHTSSLILATGGSGHGFKFFPVIGEKIVDALEGKLDPDLAKIWRWRADSEEEEGFCATEDGSRSGARGMVLRDELAKGV